MYNKGADVLPKATKAIIANPTNIALSIGWPCGSIPNELKLGLPFHGMETARYSSRSIDTSSQWADSRKEEKPRTFHSRVHLISELSWTTAARLRSQKWVCHHPRISSSIGLQHKRGRGNELSSCEQITKELPNSIPRKSDTTLYKYMYKVPWPQQL